MGKIVFFCPSNCFGGTHEHPYRR